jgi:hypothetical protein
MIHAHRRMLVFIGAMLALAASLARAGSIEYPMPGNFETAEGTIEIWFSPIVELKADEGKDHRSLAKLMTIKVPDGFTLGASCFTKHSRMMVGFSMAHASDEKGLLPIWTENTPPIKPGEEIHLALTWRGREMVGYMNGKPIGQRTQGKGFEGVLVNQVMSFGDASREPAIVLHAVRVSRAARDEASLKDAKPDADDLTLLLDRFDTSEHVSAEGQSSPQKSSSLDGKKAGTLRGSWRFVADLKPGIDLSPQSEERGKP